jgi:hypothetical protein
MCEQDKPNQETTPQSEIDFLTQRPKPENDPEGLVLPMTEADTPGGNKDIDHF